VDRSEQSYSSPPGAVHLRGVPDSLVHRLCTGNAVYEIVKLHIGRMFFPQWVGTDTLHLLDTVDKSVVLWYNEEKRTGVFLHGEQLSTARYVRCDVGNSQAVHNRKQGNV